MSAFRCGDQNIKFAQKGGGGGGRQSDGAKIYLGKGILGAKYIEIQNI